MPLLLGPTGEHRAVKLASRPSATFAAVVPCRSGRCRTYRISQAAGRLCADRILLVLAACTGGRWRGKGRPGWGRSRPRCRCSGRRSSARRWADKPPAWNSRCCRSAGPAVFFVASLFAATHILGSVTAGQVDRTVSSWPLVRQKWVAGHAPVPRSWSTQPARQKAHGPVSAVKRPARPTTSLLLDLAPGRGQAAKPPPDTPDPAVLSDRRPHPSIQSTADFKTSPSAQRRAGYIMSEKKDDDACSWCRWARAPALPDPRPGCSGPVDYARRLNDRLLR